MFVEEVWSQSSKWYQTWDDQLLYSRENGFRWAIILYRKSMGSVLVVWILQWDMGSYGMNMHYMVISHNRVPQQTNFISPFFFYLLGNEGYGMRSKVEEKCSKLISIHPGRELHPGIDSLNVSVATGKRCRVCVGGRLWRWWECGQSLLMFCRHARIMWMHCWLWNWWTVHKKSVVKW